ncbi:molybdopterin-dependent oxidoreductase [Achromobacter insuavis]
MGTEHERQPAHRGHRLPLLRRGLRHDPARGTGAGGEDHRQPRASQQLRPPLHQGVVGPPCPAAVGPAGARLRARPARPGPGAAADGGHPARHRRAAARHHRRARPRCGIAVRVGTDVDRGQYLANKLAKGFIGTNNIESNSRLCMASAGSGYKLSLGADGPPGSYQDIDRADLFLVIGANMADCHPILYLRMMDRVKAGARLIVVDPRRTTTAEKAHLHLAIKPGTDLALLNGLLHLLHEAGKTDAAFIAAHTDGWEAMPDLLRDYAPERVEALTGIAAAQLRQAADWIGAAPEWMSCWTMGLNQSTHGTWNTNALCNLHLATGRICRPGSGPFSLTGQPNAMGGREMGYMGPACRASAACCRPPTAPLSKRWGVPAGTLHTRLGQGTIDLFQRMAAGEVKACWIICTNPVASVANRANVVAGLRAAELVIAQDAYLDTETNRYADILLPGALWAEADGVMINPNAP